LATYKERKKKRLGTYTCYSKEVSLKDKKIKKIKKNKKTMVPSPFLPVATFLYFN
jgi:hypothetical protein